MSKFFYFQKGDVSLSLSNKNRFWLVLPLKDKKALYVGSTVFIQHDSGLGKPIDTGNNKIREFLTYE